MSADPVAAAPAPAPAVAKPAATIGASIRIKGDLVGDEDLTVDGQVEGTISLPNNLLTVGKDGQVNASVTARAIDVQGKVEGDLRGQEMVILKRSGSVHGNIAAPRVTLEDGCRFKGSIDMEESGGGQRGTGFVSSKVSDLKAAPVAASEDASKASRS